MVKYHAKTNILIMLAFLLSSCATTKVTAHKFHYYILDPDNQVLIGPTEEDNKPLKSCARYDGGFHCTAMFIEDFFQMKSEYEKALLRIKELENHEL